MNVFNLFNRVNFANPIGTLSNVRFGQITSTRPDVTPRSELWVEHSGDGGATWAPARRLARGKGPADYAFLHRVRDRVMVSWTTADGHRVLDTSAGAAASVLRTLRRQPTYAMAAVCAAALGVAGATTVASVAQGVLLRSDGYRDPERLVLVTARDPGRGATPVAPSIAEYLDLRARTRSFSALASLVTLSYNLPGDCSNPAFPIEVNFGWRPPASTACCRTWSRSAGVRSACAWRSGPAAPAWWAR